MTDGNEIVHVAWGVSRAQAVREALASQGDGARVIALLHDLSVGPIASLDPVTRRAWFEANTRWDEEACEDLGDPEDAWAEATAAHVHPVFWVCLTDAGEHASFLEFVSRRDGRPFDIVDATDLEPDACSVSPFWSLGQMRPEEIVASGLGRRRRPFPRDESEAVAAAWSRVRRENAPLRVVRNGRLVSASPTLFDAVLTEQATGEWEVLAKLVGRSLQDLETADDPPGRGCSYGFLFARVLALAGAGALEVTGTGPGMRDFRVRRSAARP